MFVSMRKIVPTLFVVVSFGQAYAGDGQETLKATVVEESKPAAAAPAKSPKPDTAKSAALSGGFKNSVCTYGGQKRLVELVDLASTGGKGCEVHYKKETEQPGHDEVLWKAQNDVTYCAGKAEAFVEKLSGMGWTCTGG